MQMDLSYEFCDSHNSVAEGSNPDGCYGRSAGKWYPSTSWHFETSKNIWLFKEPSCYHKIFQSD